MMVFITSCAEMMTTQPTIKMDAPPPQTPQLQTFKTTGEYLKAGKASFDAKQFDEAQAYLSDAVRLDQKNQAAHLLLGVTMVKLGKGADARREFDKAVQIDAKTGDAETAKAWLKRLDNPLVVGIIPPKITVSSPVKSEIFDDRERIAEAAQIILQKNLKFIPTVQSAYFQKLSKTFSACGFYSTVKFDELKSIIIDADTYRENIGSTQILTPTSKTRTNDSMIGSFISRAKNKNVKILIAGSIEDYMSTERDGSSYNHTLTCGINIDLISVKDSMVIKRLSNKITHDKVKTDEIKDVITKTWDELFQKMALEIHNALL
jgi:tetratricopeptide (TPR) repeat protein